MSTLQKNLMTIIAKLMNIFRYLSKLLTSINKYAILFLPRETFLNHSFSVERVFTIMTQTFEQYVEQHDGQNEFTNRRREQVLANARRESAAYLAEIDQEVQRNGLHAVKKVRCAECKSSYSESDMANNGLVCKFCQQKQEQDFLARARKHVQPSVAPQEPMSREAYNAMFNPCGIM